MAVRDWPSRGAEGRGSGRSRTRRHDRSVSPEHLGRRRSGRLPVGHHAGGETVAATRQHTGTYTAEDETGMTETSHRDFDVLERAGVVLLAFQFALLVD